MYEIKSDVIVWICSENETDAINMFLTYYGDRLWSKAVNLYGTDAIREMDSYERFTYVLDDENEDNDTIENLIDKYCTAPEVFTVNEEERTFEGGDFY